MLPCRVDAASQAAALNALASLQSIAAAQGAATLGQAPPTLLPSRPLDIAAFQRHQVGAAAKPLTDLRRLSCVRLAQAAHP